MVKILFLLSLFLLISFHSKSETLTTEYFSFSIPALWTCQESSQRVHCILTNQATPYDAVFTCAYREKEDTDSMEIYKLKLKEIHVRKDTQNKPFKNKILFTKDVKVRSIPFIDSLQYSSEWPKRYSRYHATVFNNLALLCSFTAIKYTSYLPDFMSMLNSLIIFPHKIPKQDNDKYITNQEFGKPIDQEKKDNPIPQMKDKESNTLLVVLIIILFFIGIIYFLNSRKLRNDKPPPTDFPSRPKS